MTSTPLGVVHLRFRLGEEPTQYLDNTITLKDAQRMAKKDLAEDLVGNGLAKVTSSISIGDKDYGNGFEAHCSVQLSVNQDRASIEDAQDLAQELSEAHMERAFEAAEELYKNMRRRK